MRKTLFHANHMGIRGTEVALYDYAYHNQSLLGNRSYIVYDRHHEDNNPDVIEKFQRAFPLYTYDDFSEVEGLIEKLDCDALYLIKWGFGDGKISTLVPNLVHAVFETPPDEAHGAVFAYISEWLARHAGGEFPFVPHMINLPDHAMTLRAKLNIPKNEMVFGSYGGHDSFDVPFARDCVRETLARRADVHFLFMNYPKFLEHERAVFFQGTPNPEFKTAFINTCDAMLHARVRGETFGLACGEFSSRNKPVLTWGRSPERGHIDILGKQALLYDDAKDLMTLLTGLDGQTAAKGSFRAYAEKFSPAAVMRQFQSVFLDPTAGSPTAR